MVRSNTSSFRLLFCTFKSPTKTAFMIWIVYMHLLKISETQWTSSSGVFCQQMSLDWDCEAWLKKGDPQQDAVKCNVSIQISWLWLVRDLVLFQTAFVGTLSEFCVKHAEYPVVTIKRKTDETLQGHVDD